MASDVMPDCSKMTYREMANTVRAIAYEVKERNPIFVNFYMEPICSAIAALEEISDGERDNFTSESGPPEP